MPNKVTIKLSLDSGSTDGHGVVIGGSDDSAPSPLSMDALGAPADSEQGDARSAGAAPSPRPLDELLGSSRQESDAPAPSPLEAPSSAGEDAPVPLDELPGEKSEG